MCTATTARSRTGSARQRPMSRSCRVDLSGRPYDRLSRCDSCGGSPGNSLPTVLCHVSPLDTVASGSHRNLRKPVGRCGAVSEGGGRNAARGAAELEGCQAAVSSCTYGVHTMRGGSCGGRRVRCRRKSQSLIPIIRTARRQPQDHSRSHSRTEGVQDVWQERAHVTNFEPSTTFRAECVESTTVPTEQERMSSCSSPM
jgi:hypothetical protein